MKKNYKSLDQVFREFDKMFSESLLDNGISLIDKEQEEQEDTDYKKEVTYLELDS